jgi:hypothetical protein
LADAQKVLTSARCGHPPAGEDAHRDPQTQNPPLSHTNASADYLLMRKGCLWPFPAFFIFNNNVKIFTTGKRKYFWLM